MRAPSPIPNLCRFSPADPRARRVRLAQPTGPARLLTIALVYGAPALYLFGNLIFKRSVGAPWLRSHLVGTAALIAIGAGSMLIESGPSALAHSWIANLILIGVVIGEEVDFRATMRARHAERVAREGQLG